MPELTMSDILAEPAGDSRVTGISLFVQFAALGMATCPANCITSMMEAIIRAVMRSETGE
jgi:hypothetical protein